MTPWGEQMKHIAIFLMAFIGYSVVHAEPQQVPAVFNTIYVPGGFDSNDSVQIVGEGMFRNTCYRPANTLYSVDHEKKEIRLGPVAYEYGGLCLQMILPFERVIDVGILKPGKYDVVLSSDGKKLGEIPVRLATTASPDDVLYAPISQAFFHQRGVVGEILLTGEFLSDCVTLDDVKITVEPKVIVVQPIAKVEDRTMCLRGRFPFSKVVKVEFVPKGRYLLHVRSLNGKSVNTLVNVE